MSSFKKLLVVVVFLLMAVIIGMSLSGKVVKPLLIDNFEDGNITANPNWWVFDKVKLTLEENANQEKYKELGKYVLDVKGKAKDWYVGGFGMYLGMPVDKYTNIELAVFGTGKGNGKLKIELFDDDNQSKELEQNAKFEPTKDDRFAYELDIDWEGWRIVSIPFLEFENINPGVGNDKWDPDGKGGSAGLLHVQFIVLGSDADGDVSFKMDNIKITYEE